MTKLKEKIINLIPSKTVKKFLRENADKTDADTLVRILADMPESLENKKIILMELLNENLSDGHKSEVQKHINFLETVIDELENLDRSKGTLVMNTISNDYYKEYPEDYSEGISHKLYCSSPELSYINAIDVMCGNIFDEDKALDEEIPGYVFRFSYEDVEDESEDIPHKYRYYHELELYKIEQDRFVLKYIYTIDYMCRAIYVRQPDKTTLWQGGNKFDFNEVYGVGDIVFVKGMPFYYPEYCVMLKDIMCAFISIYGFVKIGSFKDGVYSDAHLRGDEYVNIIFCSEKVDGALPEEYNSMKELSNMIKAEPKLAKVLLELELNNNDYTPKQVVELMKKIDNKT